MCAREAPALCVEDEWHWHSRAPARIYACERPCQLRGRKGARSLTVDWATPGAEFGPGAGSSPMYGPQRLIEPPQRGRPAPGAW